jgi:hypothetical protein
VGCANVSRPPAIDFYAKYLTQVLPGQAIAGRSAKRLFQVVGGYGLADQLGVVDATKREQKLGNRIKSGADSIQDCCDMLAKHCPIRAATIQINFLRVGEETILWIGQPSHDSFVKAAFQQIKQGIDSLGAVFLDPLPHGDRQCIDIDPDLVNLRWSDTLFAFGSWSEVCVRYSSLKAKTRKHPPGVQGSGDLPRTAKLPLL